MEKIVEVLEGLTGGTTDTIYDLFFTEKRVVAAIVLHHSDLSELYMKLNPLTVMFIGGMWTSREAKMRSIRLIDTRRKAFKDKTPEEILTTHKANIEIDYDNIVSVTTKKGLLTTTLEFNVQNYPEKKIKFSLKRDKIAEAKKVIDKVLPSKISP